MPPTPSTSRPTVPRPSPRSNPALKATGKMPRCDLDLLRREASGETFEDSAPPSSVVLPLVKRKRRD
jgi:hypothetical protein